MSESIKTVEVDFNDVERHGMIRAPRELNKGLCRGDVVQLYDSVEEMSRVAVLTRESEKSLFFSILPSYATWKSNFGYQYSSFNASQYVRPKFFGPINSSNFETQTCASTAHDKQLEKV